MKADESLESKEEIKMFLGSVDLSRSLKHGH